MAKLPEIKLPEKEELEYKEKEFLLSLYEQFERSSKIWFAALLLAVLLAFPLKLILESQFSSRLVASLKSLPLNQNPYQPLELEVVRRGIVEVQSGVYSAYAQILNSNPTLAAREFVYELVLKDTSGKILAQNSGRSFALRGESRFLLWPKINLSSRPEQVELQVQDAKWTASNPPIPRLEVLQQGSGVTAENQFFVEGVLKNQEGFGMKKVELSVIIFGPAGSQVLALNVSEVSDLKAFEGRYFRVLWPKPITNLGLVEIIAEVNPFAPGLRIDEQDKIPSR